MAIPSFHSINFRAIASTDQVAVAAYQIDGEKGVGCTVPSEVFHTEDGTQILKNFLEDVCGVNGIGHRHHSWKVPLLN